MIARFIPLLLSLLLCSLAFAQPVYRWVDDEGETHYGHSVPPEFKDRGYERLGPDGQVLQRVERALTDEERAERNRERARQAQLESEQRSQETRDRLLLAAYKSEQDIINSLEMQVLSIDSQRKTIENSLQRSSSRFEGLVTRAAQLTRDGETVPVQLGENIEQARSEMRELRRGIEDLDQREAELRERFSAELERFRQLTQNDPH